MIISIIMATYNRAHLISESLNSILNQSYKNWECLVIDDGSSDNTSEIVNFYFKKDSRINYFKRSDSHQKGLPGCRNYGLEKSSGDYVIFFDDDDIVHPENLSTCIKILEGSEFDFCHYEKRSFIDDVQEFDKLPRQISKFSIGPEEIEAVVTNDIALASCTVMWKSKCFDKINFLESLKYAEEWECYLRILLKGYSGVGIRAILYYNRKHSKSNTGEFWEGNRDRGESYVIAIKITIKNIWEQGLLSKKLIRHFVQLSIFLKNKSILNYVLLMSELKAISRLKYKTLFILYPILVIGYRSKRFLKNL